MQDESQVETTHTSNKTNTDVPKCNYVLGTATVMKKALPTNFDKFHHTQNEEESGIGYH